MLYNYVSSLTRGDIFFAEGGYVQIILDKNKKKVYKNILRFLIYFASFYLSWNTEGVINIYNTCIKTILSQRGQIPSQRPQIPSHRPQIPSHYPWILSHYPWILSHLFLDRYGTILTLYW